ncbi:MAG TPA: flagellar biosynthetic protein FliO [Edaphobacter sp.]|nr:flagellar biosynthetic protein FliO [Edaphobacter sp.]
MQSSQNAARMNRTKALPDLGGVGGWLLGLLRGVRSERRSAIRQMHLLETLPLGGKRQLMLVSCAGEHFLVGGGPESIATIVRVQAEISQDVAARKLGAPCL